MLGAELGGAEDTADGDEDTTADGDVEMPTAPVSEAVVDGLFDADAAATMTTSAPNAMSPESTLCRAGQDLRFRLFGVCGGVADCCCHGEGWGASC